MRILNIEDTATKHADITRALRQSGITDVDWAKNLEDGLAVLKDPAVKYDLVITDMYYPIEPGGYETEAGMVLIEKMRDMQLSIPIIVCSSARLRIFGILGTVYYAPGADWESELKGLLESLG